MLKVVKFGGTSVADATQIKKIGDIIRSDSARRFVVPSAPGKRFSADEKVTDLLYKCHSLSDNKDECNNTFDLIEKRYLEIAHDLGVTDTRINSELQIVREALLKGCTKDYIASRGEYLNGIIISAYLGFEFVDAAEIIKFDNNGIFMADLTQELASKKLSGMSGAVVPGFYGSMENGEVKTFSRGGSDVTGSIVSRAVNADVYENWTDVSGFLVADPRIVENPAVIRQITYKELRELSYMGATVLHEDAVFPVRMCGIPINIKNTNAPQEPGTMIVPHSHDNTASAITGIAGKKGFTIITLEKDQMNNETGFGRRVLSVLEKNNIPFEHLPTGIDAMSVVVSDKDINGKLDTIVDEMRAEVNPDCIEILSDMALVATVGKGMIRSIGTSGRLFTALGKSDINVRMIDQGSGELNIIIGVDNTDFEKTIRAIYNEFFA